MFVDICNKIVHTLSPESCILLIFEELKNIKAFSCSNLKPHAAGFINLKIPTLRVIQQVGPGFNCNHFSIND